MSGITGDKAGSGRDPRLALADISPEVRAAIETMLHLCRERDSLDFEERVFRFFCEYDHVRSWQIESLKAQLVDALQWSVKPLHVGSVARQMSDDQRERGGGE